MIDAYKPVERSINFSLRAHGFPAIDTETIKRTVGWGDRHLLEAFVGKERVAAVLKTYRRHHKESLKNGSKLLPGAGKLLRYLAKNRFKLAVASNRPTKYSHIVMRHLKIRDFFDYVLCADKAKRPKPYPDILKTILGRFSLTPSQALFVGDMTIDVQTGKRARVKTVAVASGSSRADELEALKPFAVIHHLDELVLILNGRAALARKF